MPYRNILVIKLRYIGDVLLATPLFHAIKEAGATTKVTVAVNAGTAAILKGNPDVDEVFVVEKGTLAAQARFVSAMRRRKFDCAIDLTDGDRSALLGWLSGAPVRIGFNEENRWRGLLYSSVAKAGPQEAHRIDRDLAVLRPLGISPKAGPLVLHVSPEDENSGVRILKEVGISDRVSSPLVMLHPGARYWFKAWPAERFASLADRLATTHGCRILVGGATGDREMARAIQQSAQSAPILMAGRLTWGQFAAVLKRCTLFVGNDNGAMHMASALGTPLVALFGPSNPAEWGPRGGPAVTIYKGVDCRPCFHPTCDRGERNCMKLISVEEVFAAAERLLTLKEPVGGRA
ncbi:MAG: putative lipopolysaccharide heptosyltransferase III [Nitrospiraceae bacterium]